MAALAPAALSAFSAHQASSLQGDKLRASRQAAAMKAKADAAVLTTTALNNHMADIRTGLVGDQAAVTAKTAQVAALQARIRAAGGTVPAS
jgi:capsule polysaccharide export protein KpsE/RkpR